jgi:glycosyltransferase involved in cell wall biosynthesis
MPAPRTALRVVVLNWRDTAHPEGGGSERYVEAMAEGLVLRGHDVRVLCAAHGEAPRDEVRAGVRYRRRGGHLAVYPRAVLHLLRRPADVVVDVQNGLPFFSRLAARRVVVLVHHVHREQWPVVFGPRLARLGWWIESRVAPRLYRGCPYVTVSGSTREELVSLGVRPGDIRVVRNATEPPLAVEVQPAATPTLCVVSRLVPHKRVDHALAVLDRLRHRRPDLRLVVVGHGWAEDDLRARVRALGLADRVELLGRVDELTKHRVLAASWLHLCPSLKEGWGRAVMEAATHGVPTIAYASAGGVTEAVQDGRTGLLVDDLDGLTGAVDELLADPRRRQRMGTEARRYAAGFTWSGAVDAFADLLERCGSRRSAVAVVVERLLHRGGVRRGLLSGHDDPESGADRERDADDDRHDDGHESRHAGAPPSGLTGTLPAGSPERDRRRAMTGTAAAAPTSSASAAASAITNGAALGEGAEGTVATSPGSR